MSLLFTNQLEIKKDRYLEYLIDRKVIIPELTADYTISSDNIIPESAGITLSKIPQQSEFKEYITEYLSYNNLETSKKFNPYSLKVFLNGLRLKMNVDYYTYNNKQIIINETLYPDDVIIVDYIEEQYYYETNEITEYLNKNNMKTTYPMDISSVRVFLNGVRLKINDDFFIIDQKEVKLSDILLQEMSENDEITIDYRRL